MDISVIVHLCKMEIQMHMRQRFLKSVFHVIQPSIQQLLYKESVVRTKDELQLTLKSSEVLLRLQGSAWQCQNSSYHVFT